MLFKVEVTDANLLHNWRNYVVKRTTDDADIIKRFKILHNIKVIFFKHFQHIILSGSEA